MELYLLGMNIMLVVVIAFTPYYSKKSILFGYRLGEELGTSPGAAGIRRKHVIGVLLWGALVTLVAYMLPVTGEWIGIFHIGLFLIGRFGIYGLSWKESRAYLEAHKDEVKMQKKVVVSTEKRTTGVSPAWFLISLLIALGMFVIIYLYYDQIPQQMPIRYDLAGNVTGYEEKSYWELSKLPLIDLGVTMLLFYSFMVVGRSKEDLSGKNLRRTLKQSKRFKQIMAKGLVGMSIFINLFFFYTFLIMTGLIGFSGLWHNVLFFGAPILMILPVIYLSVRVGQDGTLLKEDVGTDDLEEEVIVDDNDLWKFGMFYYNPDDPSVWVPKRYGIGRTVNFARKEAWIFVVVIVAVVIVTALL